MISGFFHTLPTIASSLFTFEVLIALLIGVVGGMVIGALPGLSATMGIALMIPFTYAMEPTAALVMLMTIYTSAIAGGSISAILIHTPGTPSSAATAMDGYPLTLQGRGLEALGTAMVTAVSLPAACFCCTEIWLCREFLSCGLRSEHHREPRF